jgi:hypothetical protein
VLATLLPLVAVNAGTAIKNPLASNAIVTITQMTLVVFFNIVPLL